MLVSSAAVPLPWCSLAFYGCNFKFALYLLPMPLRYIPYWLCSASALSKMPSRQVGNLAVAAAFALFAVFLFCARDEHGAWRPNPFCVSPMCTENRPAATVSIAGSKANKPPNTAARSTSKGGTSTPLSKEVKDAATGLSLPRTKRFTRSELTCLGVGVRAKSIAIAKISVYTVGLYVEPKGARGALKKYAGSDPASLKSDASLFKVLGEAGGFHKYLHLVFARGVAAQKVVDALTSVKGVREDVLAR